MIRSASGSYEFVDFRETAPDAAFEDMFKDNVNGSIFGGLARCGFSTPFRDIADDDTVESQASLKGSITSTKNMENWLGLQYYNRLSGLLSKVSWSQRTSKQLWNCQPSSTSLTSYPRILLGRRTLPPTALDLGREI